jgi:hypothetical protein
MPEQYNDLIILRLRQQGTLVFVGIFHPQVKNTFKQPKSVCRLVTLSFVTRHPSRML